MERLYVVSDSNETLRIHEGEVLGLVNLIAKKTERALEGMKTA